MNEWISDGGVCRTAPAIPGLLIISYLKNNMLTINLYNLKNPSYGGQLNISKCQDNITYNKKNKKNQEVLRKSKKNREKQKQKQG